jgi:prepilin-type N-terminal cleavage/methylation domain-containing protein
MKSKAGFTLVEVMVVAIIVAILAAVAIPLMSANKKRAMSTEAEAALGTVRSALRAMYAQTDAYNVDLNGAAIAAGPVAQVPGIDAGDLAGRYFDDAAYAITAIGANTYTLTATGNNSTAPDAADVAGVVITLNEAGLFTRAGL